VKTLIVLALAGLGAQLVDGSLGMGYGVTSTTLLLALGTNPAAASATVHLAEIGTNLASGLSHWRFGNVDWKVVAKIGVPGAVGAFAGATVLSNLSTEVAAPVMSLILLALGLYLLVRFTLRGIDKRHLGKPMRKRFLAPLGLAAGFVDATGGGGWGPVSTPAILASGRLEPRKTIGSIDTSEFLVSVAASLGFLFALGDQGIKLLWVVGLLAGGLVAAPLAAWLVRYVPPRLLGAGVGGMIVVTNAKSLLNSDWLAAGDGVRYSVYAVIYLVWAAAVAYSFREYRKDRVQESADALAAEAARLAEAERAARPNQVAPVAGDTVRAGRPSAPTD
jgi:uncharacterized membrane protein YfcA